MNDPILELRDLSVGYRLGRGRTVPLASGLNLALAPGTLTALVGRNGAGKSTLLRTLARLLPPLEGQVLFRGRPVGTLGARDFARSVSLVLPERDAPPNLTVRDLVSLGRTPHTDWRGRLEEGDRRAVEEALTTLELEALADRRVVSLSDGERQRAFVARALAQEPELLLLDEPTAFSDLLHKAEVLRILRETCLRGATVLLILHDISVALRFAHRIWVLEEGRVEEGIPEDLLLAGTLERLFSSPRLRFDPLRGTYRVPQEEFRGAVALRGEGRAEACAALALERWKLRQDPDASLVLEARDGVFRLREGDRDLGVFGRLEDLERELRRHLPGEAPGTAEGS